MRHAQRQLHYTKGSLSILQSYLVVLTFATSICYLLYLIVFSRQVVLFFGNFQMNSFFVLQKMIITIISTKINFGIVH